MKKWRCAQCGYIHDGEEPPPVCPNCGAPREDFVEVKGEESQKVDRSRHTNALHCRLVSLAREIEAVSKDGIQDNLDPACVNIFQKSLQAAYEIMKRSMTEMATHMRKSKWG